MTAARRAWRTRYGNIGLLPCDNGMIFDMKNYFLVPTLVVIVSLQLLGQAVTPTTVHVNGVILHYIERGHGEPLILLHGGVGDYSSWSAQLDSFSRHYRVISYSRRYNYPNGNRSNAENHSAYVEADDLTAFIRRLKLGRVHLVGVSAGALTALVFAVQHPEMVNSLVLAEPPLHEWVKDLPGGGVVYKEFMTGLWKPMTNAFAQGDTVQAMRIFVDGLSSVRRFDSLAPEIRSSILRNSRAIEALTRSSDPFSKLSRDQVRGLDIPILIVTGEKTVTIHKLVNAELAHVLPNPQQVVIPKAGHSSPRDNPDAFNAEVLKFLTGLRK